MKDPIAPKGAPTESQFTDNITNIADVYNDIQLLKPNIDNFLS